LLAQLLFLPRAHSRAAHLLPSAPLCLPSRATWASATPPPSPAQLRPACGPSLPPGPKTPAPTEHVAPLPPGPHRVTLPDRAGRLGRPVFLAEPPLCS